MATVTTHAIDPAFYQKLPFNPIKNFSPIALHARVDWGVAVPQAQPAMRAEPASRLRQVDIPEGGNP